jgi:hypothetical protein
MNRLNEELDNFFAGIAGFPVTLDLERRLRRIIWSAYLSALEEAAQLCDSRRNVNAIDCQRAIRALITKHLEL